MSAKRQKSSRVPSRAPSERAPSERAPSERAPSERAPSVPNRLVEASNEGGNLEPFLTMPGGPLWGGFFTKKELDALAAVEPVEPLPTRPTGKRRKVDSVFTPNMLRKTIMNIKVVNEQIYIYHNVWGSEGISSSELFSGLFERISKNLKYYTRNFVQMTSGGLTDFLDEKGLTNRPFDKNFYNNFPFGVQTKDADYVLSLTPLETIINPDGTLVILNYVKTLRIRLIYEDKNIIKFEFVDFINNDPMKSHFKKTTSNKKKTTNKKKKTSSNKKKTSSKKTKNY